MRKLLLVLMLVGIFSACDLPKQKKEEKEISAKQEDTQKKDSQKQKVQSLDSLVTPPALDMDKQAAMNAYNQGLKLYQEGDMEGALVEFKTVLDNYPENSNAYHYLGRIYYELGQKGLSIAYYEDAVRYDLNDTISMLGIGQVYYDMGDLTKAKEYYDMTIENAPFYGLAYYNRGTMLGMQKQYHSSLNDLNKSIELDPSNSNAYLNRGLAHFFLKDMDKACEDWHQAADMGLAKGVEAVEIYCKD